MHYEQIKQAAYKDELEKISLSKSIYEDVIEKAPRIAGSYYKKAFEEADKHNKFKTILKGSFSGNNLGLQYEYGNRLKELESNKNRLLDTANRKLRQIGMFHTKLQQNG